MSDIVTCKAVLQKSADRTRPDHLYLVLPPDFRPRILPCKPRAAAVQSDCALWEYLDRDDRLVLVPSLHSTDTGFHTSYEWECAYEVKPEGASMFDHFDAINPEVKTNWGRTA